MYDLFSPCGERDTWRVPQRYTQDQGNELANEGIRACRGPTLMSLK